MPLIYSLKHQWKSTETKPGLSYVIRPARVNIRFDVFCLWLTDKFCYDKTGLSLLKACMWSDDQTDVIKPYIKGIGGLTWFLQVDFIL